MKNLLSAVTLAISATVFSANVFASEAQYDVSVFNLSNSAVVKVYENGNPVSGVPVTVKGNTTRTLTTSESGTVIVKNNDNSSHSFKISIEEPNGYVFSTQRFISN